jgi:hypothetical protein
VTKSGGDDFSGTVFGPGFVEGMQSSNRRRIEGKGEGDQRRVGGADVDVSLGEPIKKDKI